MVNFLQQRNDFLEQQNGVLEQCNQRLADALRTLTTQADGGGSSEEQLTDG